MRTSSKRLSLVAPLLLAAACSGGGGGGGGEASAWPFRVRLTEIRTTVPAAAMLRAKTTLTEVPGVCSPGLAFLGDGTPVVGYFLRTDWNDMHVRGDLWLATVRAGTPAITMLSPGGTMLWSKMGVGPGDRLSFFDVVYGTSPTGSDGDWGYFAGTVAGATKQSTWGGAHPDGFLRAFGRTVRSPDGSMVAALAANLALGEPTRLSLWNESGGWDMSDVIATETDPDHHRLLWDMADAPSVAYDADGDPVVAYEMSQIHMTVVDPTHTDITTDAHEYWVARKKLGVWSSELVFSVAPYAPALGEDIGPYVALDAAGTVHLLVGTQGAIHYASKPTGAASWNEQQVSLDAREQTAMDFALDHGVPSILFDSKGSGAALARLENGSWSTESIDPDGFVIQGALGTDPDGLLWAVYDTDSPNGFYLNLAHRRVVPKAPAYFTVDGKQQFLASRNIAGRSVAEVESLIDQAAAAGTRLVRFHVTHLGGLGITSTGDVVESWAADWDAIFDHAKAKGVSVLPVFGVWADWNDGSNGESWHTWDQNPLNGLASSPLELYTTGSAVQKAWLGWLGKVVTRWQKHDNVVAWEVFSELDGITRGTLDDASFQARGIGFVETAAPVVRAADPSHRPVTASTGPWQRWFPAFYASKAIDIAQIHLYTPGGDLDAGMLDAVHTMLAQRFDKPILIGESGLDWAAPDGTTATTAPEGPRATRHAVWAELVSGAMNGRALWWEDGYDIPQNPDTGGPAFVAGYPAVEQPAITFLAGRDLAGLRPLTASLPASLVGGAIGGEQAALAWVRNASCSLASGWSCSTPNAGVTVSLQVPGTAPAWQVSFTDPTTGSALGSPVTAARTGSTVAVQLPPFADDIAVQLTVAP